MGVFPPYSRRVSVSITQSLVQSQLTTEQFGGEDLSQESNYLSRCHDLYYKYSREWLSDYIEHRFGLLDELRSTGVLTPQQVELIQSKLCNREATRLLVAAFHGFSQEQQELFLSALDNTGQSHVTNFIRCKAFYSCASDKDNWPLAATELIENYHKHWRQLKELIYTQHGLLDELLSVQCINSLQKQLISQPALDADKNESLLYIIGHKSVKDYKLFIECLIQTKQHRVVSLLLPTCATNNSPLTDQQISALTANYPALFKLMDVKDSLLLDHMLSSDAITWQQKDFVKQSITQADASVRLLDIVIRGSLVDFNKFIQCLRDTGQQHVVEVILSNGVVAELVTQTNLTLSGENAVIQQFNNIFRSTSPQHRQDLRKALDQISLALGEVQLLAMQKGQSIHLFFLCKSLSGLLYLDDLNSDQQLRDIVQQLFTVLINNAQLVTIVYSLAWNRSDYIRCVVYLSSVSSLQVYSHIYQLATQSSLFNTELGSSSLFPNRFPRELVEQILLKASGQLFIIMKNETSHADVHVLTSLQTVCRYWWETLTCHQRNRRLLQRFFKHVCAPNLVTSIQTLAHCNVVGVAELNDKLYILTVEPITRLTGTLLVLSIDSFGYSKCEENKTVSNFHTPVDVVACSETNCLYVSDVKERCIWRVQVTSLSTENFVDKLTVTVYFPWKLSMQASRLLVITHDGLEIYIYNCGDGALIKIVELSHLGIQLSHAKETSFGTVIVCGNEPFPFQWHESKVIEVTGDGKILREYKNVGESACPHYLTMDSKKHLLVCNKRDTGIIRVNNELTFLQILLRTKRDLKGQPWRMCYSGERGLLYVCYYELSLVDVFKV